MSSSESKRTTQRIGIARPIVQVANGCEHCGTLMETLMQMQSELDSIRHNYTEIRQVLIGSEFAPGTGLVNQVAELRRDVKKLSGGKTTAATFGGAIGAGIASAFSYFIGKH